MELTTEICKDLFRESDGGYIAETKEFEKYRVLYNKTFNRNINSLKFHHCAEAVCHLKGEPAEDFFKVVPNLLEYFNEGIIKEYWDRADFDDITKEYGMIYDFNQESKIEDIIAFYVKLRSILTDKPGTKFLKIFIDELLPS